MKQITEAIKSLEPDQLIRFISWIYDQGRESGSTHDVVFGDISDTFEEWYNTTNKKVILDQINKFKTK